MTNFFLLIIALIMKNKCIPLFILLSLLFFACSKNTEREPSHKQIGQLTTFTRSLNIVAFEDHYLVEVKEPWKNSKKTFSYILYENEDFEKDNPKATYIKIPVERIICTSTSHLPAFEYLGAADRVVGFPDTRHISSQVFKNAIKEGNLTDIGSKNGLNIEVAMSLEADLTMAFAMGSSYDTHEKITEAGTPVILNADYMEKKLIARAEWIKLTGLLLGKYKEADSIFLQIKHAYDSLEALAASVDKRPTVMSGVMYGDVWYTPGGDSWAAELIQSAGGNYLWNDQKEQSSLQLSFESVLEKAEKADLWIGAANFMTRQELLQADQRYSYFDAFEKGNIYTYSKRQGENGGNDYLESGYLRADWVMADIIRIIHPELLPDYELYYYQKLN